MEEIEGVVENVVFRNPDNGYIVLELDVSGHLITATGEMGDISPGESLVLHGGYIISNKYGSQFRVKSFQRKLPQSALAIEKYLASGAIKGIGRQLAKKMVVAFGEDTLTVLEQEPDRLLNIRGVTNRKLDEIVHNFQQTFAIQRLMAWLAENDLPTGLTVKIWNKWGRFSQNALSENPFLLCENAVGLEFPKADQLAARLDMPFDDQKRVAAGISYVLAQNALNGHTCLPTESLEKICCRILGVDSDAFYQVLKNEYTASSLREYLINQKSYTFQDEYFVAEEYIAERLSLSTAFAGENDDDLKERMQYFENVIQLTEDENGITYEKTQKDAIVSALSLGTLVLTGGPGTGKTTTVNAILSLLEQQGLRVILAAPTGRAAKRMEELTGRPSSTLHRLLGVSYGNGGDTVGFQHNENNPLPCDAVIIDEMSMVDSLLFCALLRALRLSCRVIMVGDSDQLPSVGAGNLLEALILSQKLPVVRLTEIFRQAQSSSIVTNAHKIVNGIMPDLSKKDSDFFFIKRDNTQDVILELLGLYKVRLPKAYSLDPVDDIQVLCPSKKGVLGVIELNHHIQNAMNPHVDKQHEIHGKIYSYRVGDKVMQTRNNYDITWVRDEEPGNGIFNGDIGRIISINHHAITVNFDGKTADYPPEVQDQLELAYAITVHKSQGCEFPVVIIPVWEGFPKLSYRSLLYTAVTRAKRLLVMIGSVAQVRSMIQNNCRMHRYSCLKQMIIREFEK